MKKIWLIAKMTYKKRIFSGTFLILTVGIPTLMVAVGAIQFISLRRQVNLPPVGYIDQTQQLAHIQQVQVVDQALDFDQTLQIQTFEDVEGANKGYQRGEIGGYLLIPAGYFEGQPARYYAGEEPDEMLTEGLRIVLRKAILSEAPEWALERLADPANHSFVALDSGEVIRSGPELILRFATPAGLALFLALTLVFTAGQMGAAVVQEKDQRAMEMVITSLRPGELVAGKVLGMSLLSFTQMAVWGTGIVIVVSFLLAGKVDLGSINLPWSTLTWGLLLGLPGYYLYAILACGLGIIAGDSQQAQQLAGFLGFLGMAPLWFAGIIIEAPNSALAVGLTLFPLTGPIFSLLRMAMSEVPIWQLATSFGLLVLSLVGGIWLVARIFRAAMLMVGQPLRPREIARSLRDA